MTESQARSLQLSWSGWGRRHKKALSMKMISLLMRNTGSAMGRPEEGESTVGWSSLRKEAVCWAEPSTHNKYLIINH